MYYFPCRNVLRCIPVQVSEIYLYELKRNMNDFSMLEYLNYECSEVTIELYLKMCPKLILGCIKLFSIYPRNTIKSYRRKVS